MLLAVVASMRGSCRAGVPSELRQQAQQGLAELRVSAPGSPLGLEWLSLDDSSPLAQPSPPAPPASNVYIQDAESSSGAAVAGQRGSSSRASGSAAGSHDPAEPRQASAEPQQ